MKSKIQVGKMEQLKHMKEVTKLDRIIPYPPKDPKQEINRIARNYTNAKMPKDIERMDK